MKSPVLGKAANLLLKNKLTDLMNRLKFLLDKDSRKIYLLKSNRQNSLKEFLCLLKSTTSGLTIKDGI